MARKVSKGRWHLTESLGIIIVIAAVLAYVGKGYLSNDISGSQAGTEAVTVSRDVSSPLADLALGGAVNKLDSVWKFATGSQGVVIQEVTFTLKAPAPFMTSATLKNRAGRVLANAAYSGPRLTFRFAGSPLVVPPNTGELLTVSYNLSTVDGTAVPNDIPYTTLIAQPTDIKVIDPPGAEVKLLGTQTPVVNFLVKSKPAFSVAASSPKGSLTVGSNVLIAESSVVANAAGDLAFQQQKGRLVVKIDTVLQDVGSAGFDTVKLVRKASGAVLATKDINFAAGAKTVSVPFDFGVAQFLMAAGTSEVLQVYADTDDFEDSGDSIQAWFDDAAPDNIKWNSLEMERTIIDHADILFRGDILFHVLVKP